MTTQRQEEERIKNNVERKEKVKKYLHMYVELKREKWLCFA